MTSISLLAIAGDVIAPPPLPSLPLWVIDSCKHRYVFACLCYSVGFEILEDVPDVDVIVVPCGGGGLISGYVVPSNTMSATPLI
jgi:threonine dehydratase